MSERGSKKKGKECSSNYIHYNRSEETNKQYTKRGKNGVQTRRVYAFPSYRFTPFFSGKDEGGVPFFSFAMIFPLSFSSLSTNPFSFSFYELVSSFASRFYLLFFLLFVPFPSDSVYSLPLESFLIEM